MGGGGGRGILDKDRMQYILYCIFRTPIIVQYNKSGIFKHDNMFTNLRVRLLLQKFRSHFVALRM